MAQRKLKFVYACLDHPGADADWKRINDVCKKLMSPRLFVLESRMVLRADHEHFKEELGVRKVRRTFSREVPEAFENMEVTALCAMKGSDADVVVTMRWGPKSLGPTIAPHLGLWVLVMDRGRRGRPWEWRDTYVFLSEHMMPYLGSHEATDEQAERGLRTNLRCAIEGWHAWAQRHDVSTLRRAEYE